MEVEKEQRLVFKEIAGLIKATKAATGYTTEAAPQCRFCHYSTEEPDASGAPSGFDTVCNVNKLVSYVVSPSGRCNLFVKKEQFK